MTKFPGLLEALQAATAKLPKVTGKQMFGCDVLLANDASFAMVTNKGRVAVKLRDETSHAALKKRGASTWKFGAKASSTWLLLPEKLCTDAKALQTWTHLAYAQALEAEPQKKSKPKKR